MLSVIAAQDEFGSPKLLDHLAYEKHIPGSCHNLHTQPLQLEGCFGPRVMVEVVEEVEVSVEPREGSIVDSEPS
ncbi:hypothetical protein E2C01_027666 [Portunus trituberculatus]|uniref:Uncharacterized protein n=1 Tax=Portunus trituberculatus TaxID=210409 RepID=A0A5B7EJB2_PORTR|nr:hypothetical protein [Portunus trituberculatus]